MRVTIGPASRVLDQQLLQATQSAPLMQQAHLVHAEPQTDWTRRFAEQFLTRKACRDLVIEHEQQTGRKYEAYARVRLDTFLLEPFPRYFLQHIASRQELHGIEDPAIVRTRPGARQLDPDAPLLAGVVPSVSTQASSLVSRFLQSGRVSTELVRFGQLGTSGWASLLTKRSPGDQYEVANQYGVGDVESGPPTVVEPPTVHGIAAVPLGEDYGLDAPKGLMDKLIVGDAHAFEADASVWRTILTNATHTAGLWLMESMHRDNLLLHGVEARASRSHPPHPPPLTPPSLR